MSNKVIFLFILLGCSSAKIVEPHNPNAPKDFPNSELVTATELLTRIFDGVRAPIACVPDTDEASLLLRTIRPRMEVVEDDLEALLDDPKEVEKLIAECEKNCTCGHVDDLIREHLVVLNKKQQKVLAQKKTSKRMVSCISEFEAKFCQSELYLELNKEKEDFSFDEAAP